MSELEKYELVNNTETLQELANAIKLIGSNGFLKGKTGIFETEKMVKECKNFNLEFSNVLTRNYGIRQQAMMIKYYEKN